MTTAILDSVSIDSIQEPYASNSVGSSMQAKSSAIESVTEARIRAVLRSHPYLNRKAESIQVRCTNKCLQLSGVLPSYYLKQLAQEAIKGQCRELHIENRILVVSPENEFQL